ncbi:hypothetical protein BJA5080_00452 [Bradyrhizobium diazoefficiens SEMIA 5080]|uniref:Uncharacterized protein n=1 Tax=Bradyrhizobium diazoefficiens SEMIA 5080 TaxID=754504 RepID=A0A837CHA9_9BRAD|nr:hypothetical protein BJA5080_00452 [Bradyrhizobium diazoefficiens SEMIA 5080]
MRERGSGIWGRVKRGTAKEAVGQVCSAGVQPHGPARPLHQRFGAVASTCSFCRSSAYVLTPHLLDRSIAAPYPDWAWSPLLRATSWGASPAPECHCRRRR